MATKPHNWFAVDKDGLAKLLEKRGKAFAIFELIQNAWDTDTKRVEVWLRKRAGRPFAELEVWDDDPQGFVDLAHSYTLFAESIKKDNPGKRGRFNLGEKLVLALCRRAKVKSTTGTVLFNEDGTRSQSKEKTDRGSIFEAEIRMTAEEYDEACKEIRRLVPPAHIETRFNDEVLVVREPVATFTAQLPTIKCDAEGNLTKTARQCEVRVYRPLEGEEPSIYEMGIPVVSTGDQWHVDVDQKVPVNLDRDNVPPSYLRLLRAVVLNHTHHLLDKASATAQWVTDALHHKDVDHEAVTTVLTRRYGTKRASFDPNDREANNRLTADGYVIIHGGAFGKEAWENIRDAGALHSSGELRPTPKPYSDDPDADPADVVPEDKWTDDMRAVAALAKRLAAELMDTTLHVTIVDCSNGFAACYSRGKLDLNLRRLGHCWFESWQSDLSTVLDLLIHEFAHHYESNHLDSRYYDALSDLGGRMAVAALKKPGMFG